MRKSQQEEAATDSSQDPPQASSLCEVGSQDPQRGMTTAGPGSSLVRDEDTVPEAPLGLGMGMGLSLGNGVREMP